MSGTDEVDFARVGDDGYLVGLGPDQLWAVVQRWETDFWAHYHVRDPSPDTIFLTELTDAAIMIAESRGLDSNAFAPMCTHLQDGRPLDVDSDWTPVWLVMQRLEARFRWECACPSNVELNETEAEIIEALGSERMQAEAISRTLGRPTNSQFRSILSGMVRRGVLENERIACSGYAVRPRYRRGKD